MVRINHELSIPEAELRFTFSRSSGPGGQNVNKVATRVTLSFDLANSPALSEAQREAALRALRGRVTRDGVLHLDCGSSRSQAANRREVVDRFAALLAAALRPRKPRKKTRPTAASTTRRRAEKTRRGQRKRDRAAPRRDE